MENLPFEIAPGEVKRRLDAGEKLFLIDVRRPEEYQLCRIEGSELSPMDAVPSALPHLKELAEQGPLVVFCHHGMRSANVVNWLRGQGVGNCTSMAGGIDLWSIEIDPTVPRY